MRTRTAILGCTGIALALLVIVVVAGIVIIRDMMATVPLPEAESLVDEATVGFAEVRLEPDDPWVRGIFDRSGPSPALTGREAEKILPADLVWTARRTGGGSESHLVSLSVSPRGKIFGLAIDFALWKLGRTAETRFSRVVHGGEGITSFAGSPLPGSLFVKGNRVVWASDLPTARLGVDLLGAENQAGGTARPAVLGLMPERAGALAAGAVTNEGGAVARSLALIPGGLLELPEPSAAALSGLSFAFSTTSSSEGEGDVILHFREGTTQPVMEALASDIAARISHLAPGVTFSVETRHEPAKSVLHVRAAGLDSLYERLAAWFIKGVRTIEELSEQDEARAEKAEAPQRSE